MVASSPQWSGSVCVIDSSYQIRNSGGTTIELFARSKEGFSITILVEGLSPHVVIAARDNPSPSMLEARLSDVRNDERVVKIHDPRNLWSEQGNISHWRVDVTQPNIVPKLREKLRKEWKVSSADIVFPLRLFLDRDLGPHIEVKGDVIWAQRKAPEELVSSFSDSDRMEISDSIRKSGGAGLYPTDMVLHCNVNDIHQTEPFRTPFVIASFDLETSVIRSDILCAALVIDRDGIRTEFTLDGPEKEILSRLTRIIQDEDPDIITGYNIDNFDLPRIEQRTSDLGGSDEGNALDMFGWSRRPLRDGKRGIPSRGQSRRWSIPGRCVMDAW